MNVIRWLESRFELLGMDSQPSAMRSIFGRQFGEEDLFSDDQGVIQLAAAKLLADDSDPPNFVLPNETEPSGQLLYGPIKSYNYFAKPIDCDDVHGETLGFAVAGLLGAPGLQSAKGLDSAFGADGAPMGGLLGGPPADILGEPPVI